MIETPCQEDPQLFDCDRRMTASDVQACIDTCHACPLFGPCKRMLADKDANGIKLHGIIAGQHRPWPKTGPGRQPKGPCGTIAAYYRHVRYKEPIDNMCRNAMRAHDSRKRRDRNRRRAVTS